ncbi:MAG TPA: ABC transporter ATP-binding protein [Euzebya sp.]|nr:ABC transporter ATP-binding protein [Euzebya sp.]
MTGVSWQSVRRVHPGGRHRVPVVALDDLTLDVAEGGLLVLVGPSGSGKSTALRAVAGIEPLDGGTIHLRGSDVTELPAHRRDVAMVFQDLALFPHLTVADNILFGPVIRGLAPDERTRRMRSVAEVLDLQALLERRPGELSGGERQRVALARAMVREPVVFLLDEPLSSLDTQLRLDARSQIVALQRRLGTTMVYVTHDQAEAMSMGDRIAILRDGRLEQTGTPGDVHDRPATLFVATFLGSPAMNIVAGDTPLLQPDLIVASGSAPRT